MTPNPNLNITDCQRCHRRHDNRYPCPPLRSPGGTIEQRFVRTRGLELYAKTSLPQSWRVTYVEGVAVACTCPGFHHLGRCHHLTAPLHVPIVASLGPRQYRVDCPCGDAAIALRSKRSAESWVSDHLRTSGASR